MPRQEAQRLGFTLRDRHGRYDETVPKDTVLSQSPATNGRASSRVARMTLSLSLGPERYRSRTWPART